MKIKNYTMRSYGKMDLTLDAICDCGNSLSEFEIIEELDYHGEHDHHNFFFECKECKKTFAVMFEFSHKMKPFKEVMLGQNLSNNEAWEKYEKWVEQTYPEWEKNIEGDN